jgi:hypothetical protein
MFIEFLSFTNEAILDRKSQTKDLSLLDDTVLNALDIDEHDRDSILKNQEIELTFLE